MTLLSVLIGCAETGKKAEWQKAKILAENLDHPAAIVSDDLFVYYVTGGTIASLDEGTSGVWRKPIAGGEPVQLFKGYYIDKDTVILPDFFVLAIDDKYVYWSASGTIWRTPKMGGESQQLAPGSPTEWTIDDAKIYWHNFGGENSPPTPIYVAGKNGGDAKTFSEPTITSDIAGDEEFIYWAQSDGIFRQAKNGGEKSKIYSAPEKRNVSGLIADKNNFYFTQGDGKNALYKVSKNGGEALRIAPEISHVHKFFADENNIYFVKDESPFGTSLNKVSKDGGEVIKIDGGYLSGFTVGKDSIFVTDISKIYALPK